MYMLIHFPSYYCESVGIFVVLAISLPTINTLGQLQIHRDRMLEVFPLKHVKNSDDEQW